MRGVGGKTTYLINVFVFEGSWSAEGCSEVFVEHVRDPEEASSALELNVINRCRRITVPTSIQANGEGEVSQGTE